MRAKFAMPIATAAALALAMMSGPARAADAPAAAAPYYVFQKVVYQNDGGMPDAKSYFHRLLHHIAAHIAATGGKVEIRVVNFASGVQLLVMAKDDPELARQLDDLRAKGVRFLVCHNTLEGMKLTPADLYHVADADVVPSGVAEIARLQGLGFVYLHP
jgi:intracellular sulfur oxidation DsrE/DsrF family protein